MKPVRRLEDFEEGEVGDHLSIHSGDERLPIWVLIRQTLEILLPTDVSSILWMSSQAVTMMFVGHHLGAIGISQYSAGLLVFNVMAMSVVSGLGSAIDTLGSQAFGQDPRSPMVGETLQRALILNLVLWVIMSIFFVNSKHVMLLAFGDIVGEGAARFLAYCPPYFMAQAISGTFSKTLFAQRLPGVVVSANGAAALTSPIANYFLTPRGIEGAALSLACTVGLCAATNVLFSIFHPKAIIREAQWPSPALRRKDEWITFMSVGIPSLIAVCAEWWAFEVQAFFTITISPFALAVFGVSMNIVSLMFSLALGVSVSASVIIGNALGARRPRFAAQYARFIIICDIVLCACTATLMGCFGGHIARLYTNVPEVASAVESAMPLVILCHVGDSLQFCLQGIFRGAGRPKQAAHGVLFTLWLVGMPASALYVFVFGWGVNGVLGGLLTGFVFEIPLLYFMTSQWDWNTLAEEAQTRIIGHEMIVLEDASASDRENTDITTPPEDAFELKAIAVPTMDAVVKCRNVFVDAG
ncbi:membrane transporter protein [Trypanosoma grayi]|uniref:membrane transporter protein n=1 Tax=Trypanosoma grayi TaxID=71804 RepID=UPI0004F43C93|nr:membrane transporter protein [Trypanosoma grayi]KEG14169.1 membrane transporter protein [Trypanosoma grayi]